MGSIPCASFREATTRKQKNRQAAESMIEMIIDAHMHYFNVEGFDELARLADHENSRRGWQDICETNHIAFSVAMGNSYDAPCRVGGVTPRLINLGGSLFAYSLIISLTTWDTAWGCKAKR